MAAHGKHGRKREEVGGDAAVQVIEGTALLVHIEQPTKFELVINLKTAKQIGVTIRDSVLFRADQMIR